MQGQDISLNQGIQSSDHLDKRQNLKYIMNEREFTSERTAIQYLAVKSIPYVCSGVELIAPGSEVITKEEFKSITKNIKHLKENQEEGLRFSELYVNTLQEIIATEGSFAKQKAKKDSGFLFMLLDR